MVRQPPARRTHEGPSGSKSKVMRSRLLFFLASVAVVSGCEAGGTPRSHGNGTLVMPDAAGCEETTAWAQRAAELRAAGVESPSDQAQITRLARANFFSAMAIAAVLRCRTPDAAASQAVDAALDAALDAAREAANARSFYARTILWGEAHHAANQLIEALVQQVPGGR
jgi:hypothetical protein